MNGNCKLLRETMAANRAETYCIPPAVYPQAYPCGYCPPPVYLTVPGPAGANPCAKEPAPEFGSYYSDCPQSLCDGEFVQFNRTSAEYGIGIEPDRKDIKLGCAEYYHISCGIEAECCQCEPKLEICVNGCGTGIAVPVKRDGMITLDLVMKICPRSLIELKVVCGRITLVQGGLNAYLTVEALRTP